MKLTAEFIKNNYGKKFTLIQNGKKFTNIRFFISHDMICFLRGNQKRRGQLVPWDWLTEPIELIEVKKPEFNRIGEIDKIIKKIHPNAWDNLRDELKAGKNDAEYEPDFIRPKAKFRNIKNLLTNRQQEEIKKAFENKTYFNWQRPASGFGGRDLSIEANIHQDGVFRAYFSSEFPGCGNGSYYLLISPYIALYYEDD